MLGKFSSARTVMLVKEVHFLLSSSSFNLHITVDSNAFLERIANATLLFNTLLENYFLTME